MIKLAKPVSGSTFLSITSPIMDIDRVIEVLSAIRRNFGTLQPRYLPTLSTIPLQKGMSWIPVWKATPNNDVTFNRTAKAVIKDPSELQHLVKGEKGSKPIPKLQLSRNS